MNFDNMAQSNVLYYALLILKELIQKKQTNDAWFIGVNNENKIYAYNRDRNAQTEPFYCHDPVMLTCVVYTAMSEIDPSLKY